jgi:hypothetical protein
LVLADKFSYCEKLQGSTYAFVVVFYITPVEENVVSQRDEMRRLINIIEKSAASASVEQNIEDLRLFANAANFLANKIDTKIKGGDSVKTKHSSTQKLRIPKPKAQAPKAAQQRQQARASALPQATSVATSTADFERLKFVEPSPIRADAVSGGF